MLKFLLGGTLLSFGIILTFVPPFIFGPILCIVAFGLMFMGGAKVTVDAAKVTAAGAKAVTNAIREQDLARRERELAEREAALAQEGRPPQS